MSTTTHTKEKVLANQSQRTKIVDAQTRTIAQIRNLGMDHESEHTTRYYFEQIPLEHVRPDQVV